VTDAENREIVQKFIVGLRNGDANLLKSVVTDDFVRSLPEKARCLAKHVVSDGLERHLAKRKPCLLATQWPERYLFFWLLAVLGQCRG